MRGRSRESRKQSDHLATIPPLDGTSPLAFAHQPLSRVSRVSSECVSLLDMG